MWTFSRRLLAQNRLINRNLLRNNDSIVGWFNSKPSFARGKQDNTGDEPFKVSRLFEPTQAKESSDTEFGIELTGRINKSDILKVLNKFSQKKDTKSLCLECGLDGTFESRVFNRHF